MSDVEALQEATREMDAQALLRFLITERFPGKTLVTCSLRGRSIVLLKLVADIDPATPIVFCHAPNLLSKSLEYRAEVVSQLGLTNTRDPSEDESGPASGDRDHTEGLWSENPASNIRTYKIQHLNRSLANFDCWISGVYHNPFPETPPPRVTEEGRLIRIDPLADWSRDEVHDFLADQGLAYHPRQHLRPSAPVEEPVQVVPDYHF